jgi:hypothetical protein
MIGEYESVIDVPKRSLENSKSPSSWDEGDEA